MFCFNWFSDWFVFYCHMLLFLIWLRVFEVLVRDHWYLAIYYNTIPFARIYSVIVCWLWSNYIIGCEVSWSEWISNSYIIIAVYIKLLRFLILLKCKRDISVLKFLFWQANCRLYFLWMLWCFLYSNTLHVVSYKDEIKLWLHCRSFNATWSVFERLISVWWFFFSMVIIAS